MAATIRLSQQHSCSFDHLVGEQQKRFRNRETERLGRLEVDDKLEFRGLLDREVGRLGSFEDLIHVGGAAALQVSEACDIGHDATECRKLPGHGYEGQPCFVARSTM